MISIFRTFTKSPVFTALMGLLIASFAVFGLRDVFTSTGVNNVATAGKRSVSVADYKRLFDRYKQSYAQQHNGQSFTNEDFVAQGQDVAMLNEMAGQAAVGAWFDSIGVKPSAKLIVDQLAQIPTFINPATGRFDKVTYDEALQRLGMDEKEAESELADQIANTQYMGGAMAGFKVPRIYAATASSFGLQTRDFSYFVVSDKALPAAPTPTDADIAAFYKSHLDVLTVPETRQAEIVKLSAEQFIPGIKISDDDIKKAYDARLPTLRTPETRTFVQVTAPDMAAATKIAAALKAGQSPDAAAKTYNGHVIDYAGKAQADVADDKVGTAAFAMHSGEVSDPINGTLGIGVVKMGDIKTGSTPSLDSVRTKIEDDLKRDRAADVLNKASHELADALSSGADFDAAVKKVGLTPTTLPPMTAEGHVMTTRGWSTEQDPNDWARYNVIVKDIYNLQPGGSSDVEEFGQGQYFALKLVNLKPAAAPPIAAIHDDLVRAWQMQKIGASIQDKAQDIADRLKKGTPIATLAAEVHDAVKTVTNVDRSGGAQHVPAQIMSRVFFAKPGESFQVQVAPTAYLVGHVDAIHQADPNQANMMAASLKQNLMQSVGGDVIQITKTNAATVVKSKTYPALARQALDVAPDAKGATKGKDTP